MRALPLVEQICRRIRCGHCLARPGEPCKTESGRRRSSSHAWRFDEQTRAGLLPLPAVPPPPEESTQCASC